MTIPFEIEFKHAPLIGDRLSSHMTTCIVKLEIYGKLHEVMAVAFCSKKDQFCKEIGRTIALKRVVEGGVFTTLCNNCALSRKALSMGAHKVLYTYFTRHKRNGKMAGAIYL